MLNFFLIITVKTYCKFNLWKS